jgi:hypothetical protein
VPLNHLTYFNKNNQYVALLFSSSCQIFAGGTSAPNRNLQNGQGYAMDEHRDIISDTHSGSDT